MLVEGTHDLILALEQQGNMPGEYGWIAHRTIKKYWYKGTEINQKQNHHHLLEAWTIGI